MTYEEFKNLDYPDSYPMEFVLADLMFNRQLDFVKVSQIYTNSLEKERHKLNSRFNEACINLTQLLGKNFKGKHKSEAQKRAVHTFNLCPTLPHHIHDEDYGYTEEDKKYWDEFTKRMYGIDL
jgi:hypothetical protein